ncbi:MAG: ATP-binding protein [Verrucomicrobiota bacterium]|nr:ATP-binding protein [Verrucomicrobiota bacterium]
MATIPVLVKKDHIEALVATKTPIVSVAELFWNGLDADADIVSIRFEHNGLGGLERIRVQDNGSGFNHEDANELFGNLGGSWKSEKRRTAKGRSLHGKSGKGRFRAFALGSLVEWRTRSKRGEKFVSFTVKGSLANLEAFELGEPQEMESSSTGTEVVISNPSSTVRKRHMLVMRHLRETERVLALHFRRLRSTKRLPWKLASTS